MDERKKLLLIVASVFVWSSSLLLWGGWWVHREHGSAVSAQVEKSNPRTGGSISIPLYDDVPRSIRPLTPENEATETVLSFIYEPLVERQPDGTTKNVLAESWQMDEQAGTVSVTLRKGVKWHDGEPLTADDVLYTYHKLADPNYNGSYRRLVQAIAGVEDVRSGKVKTIQGITLTEGEAPSLTFQLDEAPDSVTELLQIPIVPRHLHASSDGEPETTHLIGTGPYRMAERSEKSVIELERFSQYWDEAPSLDEVTCRTMTLEEAVTQFKEGKLDVLPQMDATNAPAVRDGLDVSPLQKTGDVFHYVAFNPMQDLWQDATLRAQMGHVIDKQQIVKQWLKGFGEKIDTPRGMQVERAKKDEVEQALKALREEELSLHFTSQWVERDGLAAQLKNQWEAAGLTVELVEHDHVSKLAKAVQTGDADLFLMTDWVRVESRALLDWWEEDDLRQWTSLSTNQLTTLLREAAEAEGKERERIMLQWNEQFVEEMPLIPLVRPKMLYFVNDGLHGVKGEHFRPDKLYVREWWVEEKG